MADQYPSRDPKGSKKRRIGEQLMDDGLISADQLQQVLKRQAQAGGQLGSILIEMGFVALDDLLDLLGRKFGVPGVNLYQRNIKEEVLRLLPVEKMSAMRVLPPRAGRTDPGAGHGESPGFCGHQRTRIFPGKENSAGGDARFHDRERSQKHCRQSRHGTAWRGAVRTGGDGKGGKVPPADAVAALSEKDRCQ